MNSIIGKPPYPVKLNMLYGHDAIELASSIGVSVYVADGSTRGKVVTASKAIEAMGRGHVVACCAIR